jgi:hypothetical protein
MHLPLTSDSVTSGFNETLSSTTTRFTFVLFRELFSGDDDNVSQNGEGLVAVGPRRGRCATCDSESANSWTQRAGICAWKLLAATGRVHNAVF